MMPPELFREWIVQEIDHCEESADYLIQESGPPMAVGTYLFRKSVLQEVLKKLDENKG